MIIFVDVSTMRGYSWKGRDCNDLDSSVHPGISLPPLPLFPSLSLILTSLHLFLHFFLFVGVIPDAKVFI